MAEPTVLEQAREALAEQAKALADHTDPAVRLLCVTVVKYLRQAALERQRCTFVQPETAQAPAAGLTEDHLRTILRDELRIIVARQAKAARAAAPKREKKEAPVVTVDPAPLTPVKNGNKVRMHVRGSRGHRFNP